MKLPETLAAMLREPLPPEAIKPHPTKPHLSSINAIYVTERLNNVFGVGGWKLKAEYLGEEKREYVTKQGEQKISRMLTVKATLLVPEYDIEIEQFGGNDNDDKGDALKGATTDALTKIGSYLGIGQDVWKNTKKNTEDGNSPTKAAKQAREGRNKFWTYQGKDKDGNDMVTGAFEGRSWYAVVKNGEREYYRSAKDGSTTDRELWLNDIVLPEADITPPNF